MSAARLAEAEKHMAEGRKLIKKGFFSKPKWDDGADAFQKAAHIFINVMNVDKALEAAVAAADAHEHAGNYYHAASMLDSIATFLKDQNREADAPQYYCKAARMFALANKPQNQADCLGKAARVVPSDKSADAIGWLQEGITALEDSERWHVLKDPYRALVLMQVRAGQLAAAIETEKKFIKAMERCDNADLGAKCGLEIVILCLALGDDVLAEREFQELTQTGFGFPHSQEQRVGFELVDASMQRDAARLAEAVKDQRISFLITEIARIAKRLKVPSGAPVKRPPALGGASMQDAAQGGGAADDDAAEEDDEDVR